MKFSILIYCIENCCLINFLFSWFCFCSCVGKILFLFQFTIGEKNRQNKKQLLRSGALCSAVFSKHRLSGWQHWLAWFLPCIGIVWTTSVWLWSKILQFSFISYKQSQLEKIWIPADNVLLIPFAVLWKSSLYDTLFPSSSSYFVLCPTLEIISILVSDHQLFSSCCIFLKSLFFPLFLSWEEF